MIHLVAEHLDKRLVHVWRPKSDLPVGMAEVHHRVPRISTHAIARAQPRRHLRRPDASAPPALHMQEWPLHGFEHAARAIVDATRILLLSALGHRWPNVLKDMI